MEQQMPYSAAREHIKNGDIVHVYAPSGWNGFTKTIVHTLIELVTGSRIYHNVVAVWMTAPGGEQRLMCVESNLPGGKRIVPLSNYSDYKLELHTLPEQFKFEDMEDHLLERVGKQHYGLMDFLAIGLWKVLRIRSQDFPGQVCSELCADAWSKAGVPGLEPSWRISPVDLRTKLIEQGIEPTILMDV